MTDLLQDDRRDAEFSEDGQYRYRLHRKWVDDRPVLGWIMLNPATADETNNDTTTSRCIKYADRWGFGKIVLGNLFALRSKDPEQLYEHDDPVGPKNDTWLHDIVDEVDQVVAAWGNHGDLDYRGRRVAAMLDVQLYALDVTQTGQPAHPSRLSGDLQLTPFEYEDPIRFATVARGRSNGVLHSSRDCHVINGKADTDLIWRPRSFFDPEQEDCGYCSEVGRS